MLDNREHDLPRIEQDLTEAQQELERIISAKPTNLDATSAFDENQGTESLGTFGKKLNKADATSAEDKKAGNGSLGTTHNEKQRYRDGTTLKADDVLVAANNLKINQQRPTMIVPFVPGTSDKLRKVAGQFGLGTWFSYPGRLFDLFTSHRGRIHLSKARDSVYCLSCSCGTQYVGESNRNLKVRIGEHLRNSSRSALTDHLLSNDHQPLLKQTQILARESNNFKRKIIESLCIDHKKSRLCNTAVSIELSPIWSLCAPMVTKQVSKSD